MATMATMAAATAAAAAAPPLSEAFRESAAQFIQSPHHLIPVDFASLNHLPDSHAWSYSDNSPYSPSSRAIPVIDLEAPNAVELVGRACKTCGLFQVTNHGVPPGLIGDVEQHTRRLFGLPAEQKQKAMRAPDRATGYGVARISPFFTKLMWHEGFTIMGSATEHASRIWPHHYQEFCDAMDNYQKKMKSLSHKILVLMLKALGVDNEQDISSSYLSEGALQLNSYPSCPNPRRAIGLAPHTDTALLTILHQNDVNGLQIFQEDTGSWIPVHPVPGSLVVNIGDFMHILSNAQFSTVLHRVVPDEAKQRVSMAYFCMPRLDFIIAPISRLPCPRFRPVTVKEYIDLKYKDLDKALHLITNI